MNDLVRKQNRSDSLPRMFRDWRARADHWNLDSLAHPPYSCAGGMVACMTHPDGFRVLVFPIILGPLVPEFHLLTAISAEDDGRNVVVSCVYQQVWESGGDDWWLDIASELHNARTRINADDTIIEDEHQTSLAAITRSLLSEFNLENNPSYPLACAYDRYRIAHGEKAGEVADFRTLIEDVWRHEAVAALDYKLGALEMPVVLAARSRPNLDINAIGWLLATAKSSSEARNIASSIRNEIIGILFSMSLRTTRLGKGALGAELGGYSLPAFLERFGVSKNSYRFLKARFRDSITTEEQFLLAARSLALLPRHSWPEDSASAESFFELVRRTLGRTSNLELGARLVSWGHPLAPFLCAEKFLDRAWSCFRSAGRVARKLRVKIDMVEVVIGLEKWLKKPSLMNLAGFEDEMQLLLRDCVWVWIISGAIKTKGESLVEAVMAKLDSGTTQITIDDFRFQMMGSIGEISKLGKSLSICVKSDHTAIDYLLRDTLFVAVHLNDPPVACLALKHSKSVLPRAWSIYELQGHKNSEVDPKLRDCAMRFVNEVNRLELTQSAFRPDPLLYR
jgi:hypothetical protein